MFVSYFTGLPVLKLPVLSFHGIPECINIVFLGLPEILVLLSGSISYLIALSYSSLFASNLSYFYFIIIPQMPTCFLRGERKGTDADGREGDGTGRNGGRESVIRMYFLENSIFNKRKEKIFKIHMQKYLFYI